ncbi:MAG: hypothetical protein JWQ70_1252, partial [Aeromicrobium sp.]|nr:hypothetical protein [Aeromicrobium sp.]
MSQTMTAEAAPILDGCTDVDSHEMLPVHMWREAFGELANDLVDVMEHAADYRDNRAENSLVRPDLVSDS